MAAIIPEGHHLVRVDGKKGTWIQTKDPNSIKPIVTTNYAFEDYQQDKGVPVIYNGQYFKSKKDLADHLGFTQSKLSREIKNKNIKIKVVKFKK